MATKAAVTIVDVVKELKAKYGQESVYILAEGDTVAVDVISTGSIGLNNALGVGGYPRGRVVEIMGDPASGKTTLTLHAIAEAQKLGLECLYIDAEHALDAIYAHNLGVNIGKLVLCQPDNAEQALDILVDATRSGQFGLIVIDSVAALSPIKEIDGESGDAHVGLLARLMSQALRRISGVAKKTNTALLFVNQYRMMIGMTGYGGPSKTTPGGKALSFYASIRLDVARIQTVGSGNESTANRTRVTVKKNKVASPYRIAEFDVVFGEGVSQEGEVIDACIMLGYIKKAGAWLKDADGNTICQGREALKDLFKSNREMFELYKSKVVNESIAGYGGVGEE